MGGFSSVETWHCLKQKKDKKRVLQGIVRLKMKKMSSLTHPICAIRADDYSIFCSVAYHS